MRRLASAGASSKPPPRAGIQLMWPLPAHVDAVAAYGAVPPHLDVDGET